MGKLLFGLKVVPLKGEISLTQAMQRSASYLLCAMFGSFLFSLSFIRKDGKSLADIVSKTSVAYDEKSKNEVSEAQTFFQLELINVTQNNKDEKIIPEQSNKVA